MKTLVLMVFLLSSFAMADDCPNLSGAYHVRQGQSQGDVVVIEQTGCETVLHKHYVILSSGEFSLYQSFLEILDGESHQDPNYPNVWRQGYFDILGTLVVTHAIDGIPDPIEYHWSTDEHGTLHVLRGSRNIAGEFVQDFEYIFDRL